MKAPSKVSYLNTYNTHPPQVSCNTLTPELTH
jgi:hypothetical protein